MSQDSSARVRRDLANVEAVFNALAHPSRRHILLVLRFRGGEMTAGEIANRFACSWPTTTRHLRILEAAGLVRVEKRGRERVHRVDTDHLLHVTSGWLKSFRDEKTRRLTGAGVGGTEMPRKETPADAVLEELRRFGLGYPGAHTKSPWPGHLDLAVNDKTFAYLSLEGEPFSISCKLPRSSAAALMLPFTKPTAYGLGKSGWVTAQLSAGRIPPVDLFKAWIDESYRAQAPKKLVASLATDAAAPGAASKGAAGSRRRHQR